ncbi:MAG: flagellin [Verrucomicrobia bacterium]|nr:flagellin [Verrucomicrobiota bacterium]
MIINTNITSQSAAARLADSSASMAKSLSRLSSGSKIVDPSDDAGGLAVASRMEAKIRRTEAARSNVNNALSLTQAQDGYLSKVYKALNRMSELAIFANDVTKADTDRSLYDLEFRQLASYISSVAEKDFNGVSLFTSSPLAVNVEAEGQTFEMTGIQLDSATYASVIGADLSTTAAATSALELVKTAITQLANDRAMLGSYMTRLNMSAEQLTFSKENLVASVSRIQDADIAEESTQFARYNILVQSGTAMLAQANSMPQTVLRLLQ